MQKDCLILNGDYRVLAVVPWQRAATLEFQEKAYPIKHYSQAVTTATGFYQLPAVMVLKNKFVKFFKSNVKLKKRNVFIRDGYRCAYCGNRFSKEDLTVDHVIPRSKGGKTSWDNLVSACAKCNRRKADTDKMKPMWRPHEPRHNQLFIIHRLEPEWRDYIQDVHLGKI